MQFLKNSKTDYKFVEYKGGITAEEFEELLSSILPYYNNMPIDKKEENITIVNPNDFITRKLVFGNEYFSINYGMTGIFVGKRAIGQNFFIATNSIKGLNSWKLGSMNGGWSQRCWNELGLTEKLKPIIPKLETLSIHCLPNRRWDNRFVLTRTNALNNDNKCVKLPISKIMLASLNKLKSNYGKGNPVYDISVLLTSALPVNLCNLNNYGSITTVLSDNKAMIAYYNYDSSIKNISGSLSDIKGSMVKSTNVIKPGRFIKDLFGNMFKDSDIEKFCTALTAVTMDMGVFKIQVVKGDDICKWYNISSYNTEQRGSLQNSCMRYNNLTNQWKFYAVHPKCSMVILTKADKLYARALLWDLHDGSQYLDRIYTSDNTQVEILRNWAKKQGIKKMYNLDDKEWEEGYKSCLLVETNLRDKAFINTCFPYTDSFTQLTRDCKYLVYRYDNRRSAGDIDSIFKRIGTIQINRNVEISNYLKTNSKSLISSGKVCVLDALDGNYKEADESECTLVGDYMRYNWQINKNGRLMTSDEITKYLLTLKEQLVKDIEDKTVNSKQIRDKQEVSVDDDMPF